MEVSTSMEIRLSVDICVDLHVSDKDKKEVTDAKENILIYYLEVYNDNVRNISCERTRINDGEKRFSKY